ncbi:unnamed protein product [Medioppia subpectinata]|uniref:Uncharacterized protein n=1 Tax=Medioppia subpectinata TaxID=1979941 RepID=A0A7R9Q2W9_9ACAR|nr:unnamed protein product [Medioppia subpectinata]CAG2110809.1 unnamed protein product [Medioppia subpectinata]
MTDSSGHDKGWNDPPLFSLDQMSRPAHQNVVQNRRNRYPQMTGSGGAPPSMAMSGQPMFAANDQQNQYPMSAGALNANPSANFEPSLDINGFVTTVHSVVASIPTLPQELVHKWQSIQTSVYSIQADAQTKAAFQSLQTSIQRQDLNSARLYANHLTNSGNELVRIVGHTVAEILRYVP